MKKLFKIVLLTMVLAAVSLTTIVGSPVEAEYAVDGWQKTSEGWYYYEDDNYYYNEWLYDNGSWYYFDYDGLMVSDELTFVNGDQFYFLEDGKLHTDKWIYGKRYKDDEERYWYYATKSGHLLNDQWLKEGDKWYYFNLNAEAITNQTKNISGNNYFFNKSGVMIENDWSFDGSYWYLSKPNGVLENKGWKKIGKDWYYFDNFGKAATNEAVKINGKNYAFSKGAKMLTNGWYKVHDDYRYGESEYFWVLAKKNGELETSKWNKTKNKWYYFDGNGYAVKSDSIRIGGKPYLFNKESELVTKVGFIKQEVLDYWDGKYVSRFYLNRDNTLAANQWKKISGQWYYFDSYGHAVTGINTINEKMYVFNDTGTLSTGGWHKLKNYVNIWTYANKDGIVPTDSWVKSGAYWYYILDNGFMATGFQNIGTDTYYFNYDGSMLANGEVESLNRLYKFDGSGRLVKVSIVE